MKDTKNVLFFLSPALNHPNFTFNLLFLYEKKHKIKPCAGFSILYFYVGFRFIFIEVYIFNQQNV